MKNLGTLPLLANILKIFCLLSPNSHVKSKISDHTEEIFNEISFQFSWIEEAETFNDNIINGIDWFNRTKRMDFDPVTTLKYLNLRLHYIPTGSSVASLSLVADNEKVSINGKVLVDEKPIYEYSKAFGIPQDVERVEEIANFFIIESYKFAEATKALE